MEKMMGDLNVKLESKIKELEFHILQLLSGREQWEEIKIKLEGEVEMLKRHNTYLEEISAIKSGNANLLPAAFKTQELVEAKLPRPTDSNPMNLFEKVSVLIT